MYPWYHRDNIGNFGQFCGPSGNTIKTENGYSDCMLGFDQYSNAPNFNNFNKVSDVYFFFLLVIDELIFFSSHNFHINYSKWLSLYLSLTLSLTLSLKGLQY